MAEPMGEGEDLSRVLQVAQGGSRVISLADAIAAEAEGSSSSDVATEEWSSWSQTASTWRLVWCYEKCHKQECASQRAALESAVSRAGGSLLCFKKAKQYAKLISRPQRRPLILLTDWREAKPCMSATMQEDTLCRPLFAAVHCEPGRMQERVTAWVRGLAWQGEEMPVVVVTEFVDFAPLMAEIARRLPPAARLLHGPGAADRQVAVHYAASRAQQLGQAATPECHHDKRLQAASTQAAAEAYMLEPLPFPTDGGSFTLQPFLSARADKLARPVYQVLEYICPSEDSVTVRLMLLEALPDHYDE